MTGLLLTSPSRNPASRCRRARGTAAGATPSQPAAFRIETPQHREAQHRALEEECDHSLSG